MLYQSSWLQDKRLADLFAFLPDSWPLPVGRKFELELLLICEISVIMWWCYSLNVFLKLVDDSILFFWNLAPCSMLDTRVSLLC